MIRSASPDFPHLLVTKWWRLHLRDEERAGLTMRVTRKRVPQAPAKVLDGTLEEAEGVQHSQDGSGR